jgi:tellurite resistance protein TerC
MKDLLTTALTKLKVHNIPVIRRAIVATIGTLVLLIGVALVVLPGPAVVVIPLGVAILATEFHWAKRWEEKGRRFLNKIRAKWAKPRG